MYVADVDREEIHDNLNVLLDYMAKTTSDNRLDLMMFLIQVAKKSSQVSFNHSCCIL